MHTEADFLKMFNLITGKRVSFTFTDDERATLKDLLRRSRIDADWRDKAMMAVLDRTGMVSYHRLMSILTVVQLAIRTKRFDYRLHPIAWRIYDALLVRLPETQAMLDEGWFTE